jgi:hypothetical protein
MEMCVKELWKAVDPTLTLTVMRSLCEQEVVCNETECLMRSEF